MNYKKIFKLILIPLLIISVYFINEEILKYKDLNRLSEKIQTQSGIVSINLSSANPSQFPIKLGALEKDKSAYFSVYFEFTGKYVENYENLFQSAPFNNGIRLEQAGTTLALIFSDNTKIDKFSVLEISNKIEIGKLYSIKIEALSKEFIQINFDEKKLIVRNPSIKFSSEEFLIGSGYDLSRNYSDEIKNIKFKKLNYKSLIGSVLRSYPKDINELFIKLAGWGLFLVFILYIVIKKNKINNFFIENKFKFKNWKLLFLIIQAIAIYVNPVYKYSTVIYVYLLLIGFYPAKFLNNKYFKIDKYLILFAPLIGLMILSLIGAYAIALDYSLIILIYLPLIFFVPNAFNRCNEFRRSVEERKCFFINLKSGFSEILFYITIFYLPIVIILTSPILQGGFENFVSTTAIRVGPDTALYSRMTQFLLDGGTWSLAKIAAPDFVGMRVGEITSYTNATMSWPFLYFYRWGLVTYQFLYVVMNGLDHIYRVAFSSMLIPLLFIGGIVFYWLRERFSLSLIASVAGSIGIIFNVNLLNTWYEGFYGNIYSLCLYSLLYLQVSQCQINKLDEVWKDRDLFKNYLCISLVIATILVSYGEGLLFVFIPLMVINLFVDLYFTKKLNFNLYIFLLMSLALALVIVSPCEFIFDWLIISIKQITEEGGNGYPQPYWANLNEILGLNNIYENIHGTNGGVSFLRSSVNTLITTIASIIIGILIILEIKQNKNNSPLTMHISAYLLIAIFIVYIYKSSPLNNYGYMKMYVFLMPLLFVYFCKACYGVAEFSSTNVKNVNGDLIAVAVSAVMVLNGVSYVINYNKTSTMISSNHLLSHAKMKKLDLKDKILLPILNSKFPNTFPALIDATWITEAWQGRKIEGDRYFDKFLEKKLYLFIEKGGCSKLLDDSKNIFYEDDNFIILATDKILKTEIQGGYLDIRNLDTLTSSIEYKECKRK
jgi:hypothetical protein